MPHAALARSLPDSFCHSSTWANSISSKDSHFLATQWDRSTGMGGSYRPIRSLSVRVPEWISSGSGGAPKQRHAIRELRLRTGIREIGVFPACTESFGSRNSLLISPQILADRGSTPLASNHVRFCLKRTFPRATAMSALDERGRRAAPMYRSGDCDVTRPIPPQCLTRGSRGVTSGSLTLSDSRSSDN